VAAIDLAGELDVLASVDADVVAPSAYRTCNVHLEPMDLDDAVRRIVHLSLGGEGRAVHLCNAYTLALTSRDATLAGAIDRSDLNLTDGMPLAWLGRRLGFDIDLERRPRGADVFLNTVIEGQPFGLRHYLYGATPDVVELLATRLRMAAPDAEIVGVESPPFRPLEADEKVALIERVRASDAQVVWVGLGTPKQDLFVDEFRDDLGATLVAVGAAFDFLAGTKKEAPAWVARSGMEWAYRFASEPRRLWKRYLIGNTQFIAGALQSRVVVVR
jgi:N-acetylglucosaminyldiphosphoundecaprenol N-acetyl-beta-D-mannosaminyltransferase